MMSKSQEFKDKYVYDIRNRDVEARGGYDPRFDKRSKPVIKNEPATPLSNLSPISRSLITDPPGKADTPLAGSVVEAPKVITPEPVEFNPSNALYYGDSIATGLGHGSAEGNANSDAQWGRSAASTLALLNSRPEGTFKEKDVVLSTGILNSGADWDTVRSQISFLKNRGARSVRLVGVPNTDQYSGWNDNLSNIANETGSIFLGGYNPGSDGVHFDYSTYPVYKRQ